jgi:hypothetical protein
VSSRINRRTPDRVPLCAAGLHLVVEAVEHGPLAPALTLRVYAGGKATNVGATFPAREAEGLAAAILAAAKRAGEAQLFVPAKANG